MNEFSDAIGKILVAHTAFSEAVGQIESCFQYSAASNEPICIALIGESRTGKSRVLETCVLNHPVERLEDGLIVPILRIKAPSKPTVKGMIEVMLDGLGAPDSHRGTENEKTRRLKVLLTQTQTQMVMIDEFQHFVDKGTKAVMHHVADWLKILVDDMNCALVVAGLPSCQAVIETNEQLGGRFLAPIRMPRFSWENVQQRSEFRSILRSFHDELSDAYDIPKLYVDEMAFRFWCATGGLVGYLVKLLRSAVWLCRTNGQKQITLSDLAVAHARSVWNPVVSDASRPFAADFLLVPTVELFRAVNQIGCAIAPLEPTRRARQRKSVEITAANVLVAQ